MDRTTMRTWAEIDLDALRSNLRVAHNKTGKKVMCVIKGDAHGHGAVACGAALARAGADAFAVACLDEAITLRTSGIVQPILILGWTPAEFAEEIVAHDLCQSVMDPAYACQLNAALAGTSRPIGIHVKLDTGMSRTGILAQNDPVQAAKTVMEIDALPHLCVEGIFTHFAAADMPCKDDFTAQQIRNYQAVLQELDNLGFDRPILRHAGNSAAILFHPEAHFDMVRAGVMLYGLSPTNDWSFEHDLRPILSLKSRVAQVKTLPAGACVSYGCTYETRQETKVAVVAAGYADAYPRALSNRGAYAVINGCRCRQIGRICMDMCMFDVTGVEVNTGDEVILYGAGGMSLEEVTNLTGGINCEPTSLLTQRVARVYVGGSQTE